jgi:hypothetical protein
MRLAGAAQAQNLVVSGSLEDRLAGWTIGDIDAHNVPPVAIFYNAASPYPTSAFGEAVPPDNSMSPCPAAVGSRAACFVSDRASNQSLTLSQQGISSHRLNCRCEEM